MLMRRRRRGDNNAETVDKTGSPAKPPLSKLTVDDAKLSTANAIHSSTDSLPKSNKKIASKVVRRTTKLTQIFTGLPSLFKRNKAAQMPPLNFETLRSELTKELEHASGLLSAPFHPDTLSKTVSQLTQSVWLVRCIVASGAAYLQPVLHVPKSPSNSLRPVLAGKNQMIMEKLFHFHDSYIEFIDWIAQFPASTGDLPNGKSSRSVLLHTSDAPTTLNAKEHSLLWLDGLRILSDLKSSSTAIFDLLDSFGFTKPIDPSVLEEAVQRRPSWSSESAVERTTPTSLSDDTSTEHFLTDADRALLVKLWSHLNELNDTSASQDGPLKPPTSQMVEPSTSTVQAYSTHDAPTLNRVPSAAYRRPTVLDDPKLPVYLNALARAVQSDHFSLGSRRSSTSSFTPMDYGLPPSEIDLNSPDQLNFLAADASDVDNEEPASPTHNAGVKADFAQIDRRSPPTSGSDAHAPVTCVISDDSERLFTPAKATQMSSPTGAPTLTQFKVLHSGEVAWDRTHSGNACNPLDDRHMLHDIAMVTMHLQNQDSASTSPILANPLSTTPADRLLPTFSTPDSSALNIFPSPDDRINPTTSKPTYHTEVKVGTIDDSELIEVDGKKFRRHFQRHIQIERHKMRQIVVAPSLPDGTGPDLSRAVRYHTPTSTGDVNNASNVSEYDHISDPSDSECDAISGNSHVLGGEIKPNEDVVHISDSDIDNRGESEAVPPQKPSLPNHVTCHEAKRPLSTYMFRFGSTLYNDDDIDASLPDKLLSFFRDGWHKSESVEGPHSRSKVMSYIQSYGQPTPTGELIRRSTCVEHTCSVHMVGGLEGLKSQSENLNSADESLYSSIGSICIEDSPPPSAPLRDSLFPAQQPKKSLLLQHSPTPVSSTESVGSCPPCRSILSLVKADDYIVWADSSSPGEVVVQAGIIDAFVVYLTSFGKTSPSFYLFFETFLDMYPSFLSTESLIDRLLLRYRLFRCDGAEQLDESKRQLHTKVCSATASIVVTVVSRLKTSLTPALQQTLLEFEEILLADNLSSLGRVLAATVRQHLSLMQHDHSDHSNLSVSHSISELSGQPGECDKNHSGTSESSTVVSDHSGANSDDPSAHRSTPTSNTVPKIGRRFLRRPRGRAASFEKSSTESASKIPYFSPRSEQISDRPSSTSCKSLLHFSARELAEQFTFLDAQKYYRIRLSELLDIPSLERGEAPSVTACANHFSAVTNWSASQLLTAPATDRGKYANHLLNVMEHLRKLKNFSSYLSVLCAFLLVPESILCKKSRARLSKISSYMQPPYFAQYRRDLEAADPPFIPYLGVMMQNLIVLAQNNPLTFKRPPKALEHVYKPEHGPIINFWRCWKHFLIIHFIIKRENIDVEKSRYSIKPRKNVLRFINDFKDSLTEIEMHRLINRLRRAAT